MSDDSRGDFSPAERDAVYKAIFTRRDVRREFLSRDLDDAVLMRLLAAAHAAPSVGFMQPWSFIVIRDPSMKTAVQALFREANDEAAAMFEPDRRPLYSQLKFEGIRTAAVNLCITCDRDRAGPVVLGRTHMRDMDIFSTVCAVQNLWLAARAEEVGVGWVSIFHEAKLKQLLGIPERIVLVAYLCLGYVSHFAESPDLERAGWRERLPLPSLIHQERWAEAVETRSMAGEVNVITTITG